MGGLDPKLAVPRRATPRAIVPAGSVAIANEQTVVYPYAISGGWSVIGRTPLAVFDAEREAAEPVRRRATACASSRSRAPSSRSYRADMSIRVLRPGLLMTVQDHRPPRPPARRPVPRRRDGPDGAHARQRAGRQRAGDGGARDHRARARSCSSSATRWSRCAAPSSRPSFPHQPAGAAPPGARVHRQPRGARRARLSRGGGRLRGRAGARQPQHLSARATSAASRAARSSAATRCRSPRLRGALARALRQAEAQDAATSVRWSAPPFTRARPRADRAARHRGRSTSPTSTPTCSAPSSTRCGASTPDSNRMGFRLARAGARAQRSKDEILSGPTCLGSVQVPANGVPIALMADHQTTGGYPRIAEIASADVPRLAQLAPGGTRALRALRPRHGGRAAQGRARTRLADRAARHRVGVRQVIRDRMNDASTSTATWARATAPGRWAPTPR